MPLMGKTMKYIKAIIFVIVVGIAILFVTGAQSSKGASDVWYRAFNNSLAPTNNVAFGQLMNSPYLSSLSATTTAGTLGTSTPTWYFEIAAADQLGKQTLPSNEMSATVSSTASNNEVIASWSAVPGASLYYVYFGGSSAGESKYATTTATSYTLATTTGATSGTPSQISQAFANYINPAGTSYLVNALKISDALTSIGSITADRIGGSSAATVATGTAAGTGAVATTTYANSVSGMLSLYAGAGASSSAAIFKITFATPFSTAPACSLIPQNAAAASLTGTSTPYMTSSAASSTIMANATALVASTTYAWAYHCSN